jgi:hypothetical protein
MRRILLVLTVAAMMAVMMVVSAVPAFAVPPNPIRGDLVSTAAKFAPADPYNPDSPGDPYKGQQISLVARGLPLDTCGPQVDSCPT